MASKPVLIATVAGTASTSYVTAKFANDYFAGLMTHKAWSGYDEADRMRALNSATATIDNVLRSHGAAADKYDTVTPEQALVFPRSGDRDSDGSLEILDDIEDATCLLALHLLKEDEGADPMSVGSLQDSGVRMMSAAGITTITKNRRFTNLPLEIENLISPYVNRGGRTTARRSRRERHWTEGWRAE